ncbi:prepilin-type N-terminal cleavage/methylation domain-containing protein [Candidatus Pacearchaeota archaeon]|nr:prepilin-type N-terminal cleavage/methylation domain-containing protein [Candidatus Pacearchaeota archaeon]
MKLLRRKGKGFAWIELLVVIAIISILIALAIPLLPGARKARQQAKAAEFSKEMILTISAAEYCENVGRKLSDYKMIGVWSDSSWYGDFQKAIPAGTEVIVGFAQSEKGYAGTALIPKDR